MSHSSYEPKRAFGLRFAMLARRWRQLLETSLAEAGMTDATWAPMVHLHESGGDLTQKQLAARLGIDASTLVRLMDILERQDLIVRRPDEQDGRVRKVSLSPAGEERVRHIRDLLWKQEALMLADLSDDRVEAMMEDLGAIGRRITALSGGEA